MTDPGSYGELVYLDAGADGRWWGLRAVPHVMIRARRMFPRGESDRHGVYKLADSADTARDLEWFLDRYPLDMTADTARVLLRRSSEYRDRAEAVDDLLAGRVPRDLPRDPARPARDYQLVAAAMARTTRRMILGDDVGLGKTMSGLLLLADPDALPALIVCPTHLPGQWLRELAATWPMLVGHAVTKGTPYRLDRIRGLAGHTPDVLVMGYSKLAGWAHALAGSRTPPRTVIFDEAQELRRGVETAKGAAAAHIASKADYAIGLTATPVYNYGDEIHNLYEILSPDSLGSRAEFRREWGGGTAGGSGAVTVSDPAGLGTYLRDAGLLLRRTRADVRRELPEPLRIRQEIDADTAALEQVRGDVEAMARLILDPAADRKTAWTASGDLDWRLRQATGLAKAPYVAEFVRMLLESERKVVLFGWHRAVYDVWLSALADYAPRLYTGSESPTQKAAAAADFIDGECRVLIVSLRSGAGLDGLQRAASACVFGELDWSLGVHTQAIGRLARDGQDATVAAYFLVSTEGADPVMDEVLELKTQQAEPIRDPDRPIFTQAVDTSDRIRRLARAVLDPGEREPTG